MTSPATLVEKLGLSTPLLGLYDLPADHEVENSVSPPPGTRVCTFAFYGQWLKGKHLLLSEDCFGCGGAAFALFQKETRPREAFLDFLVEEEGLMASRERMNEWIERPKAFKSEHGRISIGPLRDTLAPWLRSVTFFVTPDQLGALVYGRAYFQQPGDPPASIVAPFGSGCAQMIQCFERLDQPEAVIGSDLAMRKYLPESLMAVSVTLPFFEQLCQLGEESFLYKQFWAELQELRTREKERAADTPPGPILGA